MVRINHSLKIRVFAVCMAIANTTFSRWKPKGVLAKAQQYVGTSQARAYWNCR